MLKIFSVILILANIYLFCDAQTKLARDFEENVALQDMCKDATVSKHKGDEGECPIKCVECFGQEIYEKSVYKGLMDKFENNWNSFVLTTTMSEILYICQYAKSFFECFERCPSSRNKTLMQEMFTPYNFGCNYFLGVTNELECLQDSYKDSFDKCTVSDQCKDFSETAKRMLKYTINVKSADSIKRLQRLWINSCAYKLHNCASHCERPLAKAKCGANVAKFFYEDLPVSFINASEHFFEFLNIKTYYPDECHLAMKMESTKEKEPFMKEEL